MNTEYVFREDHRKHRKKMLVLTILGYLVFASIVVYEIIFPFLVYSFLIFSDYSGEYDIFAQSSPILGLVAFLGLIVAVLLTIYLKSAFSKYYMFISKTDMEFFATRSCKYQNTELISYEIINVTSRFSNYRLAFTYGKAYYIHSFKPLEFQTILNKLLEDNKKQTVEISVLMNE